MMREAGRVGQDGRKTTVGDTEGAEGGSGTDEARLVRVKACSKVSNSSTAQRSTYLYDHE